MAGWTTWRDALEALVEEIRGCDPRDVLGVGGCVLRCVAAFERELYARVDDRAYQGLRTSVEEACADVFRRADGEVLADEHVDALRAILEQALAGVDAAGDERERFAVAVRVAGDALDFVLGDRFVACLLARHPQRTVALAPRDALPLADPPLKKLMGSLSARPSALTPRTDRFRRLALVPATAFDVVLHLDRGRVLDKALAKDRRIGTALPLDSIDDLTMDEAPDSFSNVRPKDAERARDDAIRLMETAAAEGASMLVLPELCLEEASCRDVHDWLLEDRRLLVVAAGSAHTRGDDEGGCLRNRCHVFVGGRPIFAHDKNMRFALKRKDGVKSEDIETEPLCVNVVLSGAWSMTTLICKDVLAKPLADLLERLFVKVVLVPACSDRLDDFRGSIHGLVTHAQSVVAVANIAGERPGDGGEDDAEIALIAFPMKKDADRLLSVRRGEAAAPVLVSRAFDGTVLDVKRIT